MRDLNKKARSNIYIYISGFDIGSGLNPEIGLVAFSRLASTFLIHDPSIIYIDIMYMNNIVDNNKLN